MVRKKMPLVFPSRPSWVRVGDEEAGDTWTTLAGPVTAVRIGIVTDEMMPPMMTGTCRTWTSCVAASTARVPVLCESRVSATRAQPWAPPGGVEVAEGHLDRFRPRLAVFPGRAGQFHHDPDRDRAVAGPGRAGERQDGPGEEDGGGEGRASGHRSRSSEFVTVSNVCPNAL